MRNNEMDLLRNEIQKTKRKDPRCMDSRKSVQSQDQPEASSDLYLCSHAELRLAKNHYLLHPQGLPAILGLVMVGE
jgi:hypothetical protein